MVRQRNISSQNSRYARLFSSLPTETHGVSSGQKDTANAGRSVENADDANFSAAGLDKAD
ncbi:MAG: hypothetical protein DBY37_07885 [Desulfovibrionaceae bacterium]|nr:MAG: hypothetical protein DBY37_07885 [Desulfovibrionaceae bacterium]